MPRALLVFLLSTVLLALPAAGGTVPEGGPCSSTNDHLDPNTLKFISECTDQTFCSLPVNGTCIWRRCRRDEFPFGFAQQPGDGPDPPPLPPLPPMCPMGSFCPDQGSGCEPWAGLGQPCQLDRDEQCAPSPHGQDWASSRNFNGSICLHSMCMYVYSFFFFTYSKSFIIYSGMPT